MADANRRDCTSAKIQRPRRTAQLRALPAKRPHGVPEMSDAELDRRFDALIGRGRVAS